MKKDIKNNSIIIFVVIGAIVFLLGSFTMFGVIKFYPDLLALNTTKVNKNVTINDTGLADAVDKVYDAVVIVSTYKDDALYSTGTGFVYKEEGKEAFILTNNHVVSGGNKVTVTFTNGDVIETEIVGTHELSDIAVLKLNKKSIINIADIGSSDTMRVGDTTFAVGAPLDSAYSWTVTRGILSGKDRMVEIQLESGDYVMKALQTDTAINSGNSGGPLCNANGEVIGITSLKLSGQSGSNANIEGMGFAIPIEVAIEYANKIENKESITQPYLGVSMLNIADAYYYGQFYQIINEAKITKGVIIYTVEQGSPADKAGLQSGDIITKIEDHEITSIAYLRYYLYNYKVGDKVKISYIRNNDNKTTSITLGTNTSTY